jgi:DnaK suppressor protein
MSEKEKTRYSDSELQEFKELIKQKLEAAKHELSTLQESLSNANANGTEDTIGSYKTLDDGSATHSKENNSQLASRQKKFIENLEAALIRIENQTYGICKVTGKLIPAERLRAVPHTTMSIEAKLNQYR